MKRTHMKNIIKKKELINPIVDDRIVSDITFATRFKHFLEDIETSDQMGSEELEYMKMVASKLLVYQMATVKDKDEKDYFRNLGYKI